MIQPRRRDFCSFHFPLLAATNLAEFPLGGHHTHINGEIRLGELRFEHLSEAVGTKILRSKTVKMKTVARLKEGMKERYALNMIPVIVSDKNLRVDSVVTIQVRPLIAEHAQPRTAIEDKWRPVGRSEFKTGRVAAIAPCVALQRWRRAAHSPKDQPSGVMRHRRAKSLTPNPAPHKLKVRLRCHGRRGNQVSQLRLEEVVPIPRVLTPSSQIQRVITVSESILRLEFP